ncbi:MAG: protein TolR [Gammaproteobacteria bacterium]|nr:protein TolR [Gammaproteobacteria bacterium]MDH5801437.1 protein TolR [Gammaproteobacteria bacterium]
MAEIFDKTTGRRRPMSDINVVPYIDVMLVLLVIFMITAPLLTTGVQVDLPQATAEPVDTDTKEPLIVTVNKEGDYYLNVGENPDKPVNHETMVTLAAAVLQHQPGTPVMIRGDGRVEYSKVVVAMTLLQKAGAPSVGLITDAPKQTKKRSKRRKSS